MAVHLLEALRNIRTCGPKYTGRGICCNVYVQDHSDSLQDKLQELIARWPDKTPSDYDLFPIEGSSLSYHRTINKWQNPRRLALLDWLIAELEQEAQHDN